MLSGPCFIPTRVSSLWAILLLCDKHNATLGRSIHVDLTIRAAVLNLFRLADHLTNFVSVHGTPKTFFIFFGKFMNLGRPFLVIFPNFCLCSRTTKKNFANFPNFSAFFRVKDRKNIPISMCSLVVTQSMKRCTVSSETSLKGGGINFC